jgi:hypothetical protein
LAEVLLNVDLLLQKPFGGRHDTNALFYPPEIVIVGQLKLLTRIFIASV